MLYAIILFAITYVLMLTFSKYRPYIALGSMPRVWARPVTTGSMVAT